MSYVDPTGLSSCVAGSACSGSAGAIASNTFSRAVSAALALVEASILASQLVSVASTETYTTTRVTASRRIKSVAETDVVVGAGEPYYTGPTFGSLTRIIGTDTVVGAGYTAVATPETVSVTSSSGSSTATSTNTTTSISSTSSTTTTSLVAPNQLPDNSVVDSYLIYADIVASTAALIVVTGGAVLLIPGVGGGLLAGFSGATFYMLGSAISGNKPNPNGVAGAWATGFLIGLSNLLP